MKQIARLEQLKRIRAREHVEKERERLLVLEGKIKMRPEHMQDPVLKLHHDLAQLEKQARLVQARKVKRKKAKAKHKAIKMKWTCAKDKLKMKNFALNVIPPSFDDEDSQGSCMKFVESGYDFGFLMSLLIWNLESFCNATKFTKEECSETERLKIECVE